MAGRADGRPAARSAASAREPTQVDRIPATPVDLAVHSWQDRSNGAMALECEFRGSLDETLLARAADLLLDAEPILGFKLVAAGPAPHWVRVAASERTVLTVVGEQADYELARRAAMDAAGGVQVAVSLWPNRTGDRLLVKLTHVVGDGASLKLVASRLASLYSSLALDPSYRSSPAPVRCRDPRELLDRVPRRVRVRALLEFAWFMLPRLLPRAGHGLSLPARSVGPSVEMIRRLPAPALASLSRYAKRRGATLNDVFLAAAYRALAASGWDGTSALRIPITVDLRRWCLAPEHAATIANLSSWEYPYLMRDLGAGFDDTLARVGALMRRRKRSRPGLALGLIVLRVVKNSPDDVGGRRQRRPASPRSDAPRGLLTFSNEGALDETRLAFAGEAPAGARVIPPLLRLPTVHVCLSSYRGALTLAAVTSENGEAPVGRFLDAFLAELPLDEAAGDPTRASDPVRLPGTDPAGWPTRRGYTPP